MQANERGAAAVEFALVLPVLVLLIAGIADFGRAYYLQTSLSGAAREGVRTMAIEDDAGKARAAVRAAAGTLALSDGQIDVTPGTGGCVSTSATPVTARVTINYSTTYMSPLIGATLELTGTGVMRCGG